MTEPQSEWTTENDIRSRPLSLVESVFNASKDSTYPIAFAFELDIEQIGFQTFIKRVQQAWTNVAIEFPHVTSEVEGTRFVNRPLGDEKLAEWAEETFSVIDSGDSVQEFLRKREIPSKAALFFLQSQSTLVLTCPHIYIDAGGALILMGRLLHIVGSGKDIAKAPKEGHLASSVDKAMGIETFTEEQKKLAADALAEIGSAQPSVQNDPSNLSDAPSKKTSSNTIQFTQEETDKVVSAGKSSGATVTAIVYASVFQSLKKNYEVNKDAKNYASFNTVSLREGLKSMKDTMSPFGLFVGVWPMVVNVEGTPKEVLKNANDQLLKQKNLLKSDNPDRNAVSLVSRKFVEVLQSQDAGDSSNPMLRTPSISSVGVLDHFLKHEYGSIKVKSFWETTDCKTPMIFHLVWSFRGQLHINTCYNSTFYTEGYIESLNAKLKDEILGFCEV